MKKYLLAAAFVLLSTNAMADWTVTKRGSARDTKSDACDSAKTEVSESKGADEELLSYNRCECDQDRNGKWLCEVGGVVRKKEVKPTPPF